jgi:hypothetical protein
MRPLWLGTRWTRILPPRKRPLSHSRARTAPMPSIVIRRHGPFPFLLPFSGRSPKHCLRQPLPFCSSQSSPDAILPYQHLPRLAPILALNPFRAIRRVTPSCLLFIVLPCTAAFPVRRDMCSCEAESDRRYSGPAPNLARCQPLALLELYFEQYL